MNTATYGEKRDLARPCPSIILLLPLFHTIPTPGAGRYSLDKHVFTSLHLVNALTVLSQIFIELAQIATTSLKDPLGEILHTYMALSTLSCAVC
jgi:hypothetical protein